MHAPAFDIIGDVHGNLPALLALGRDLGYDVAAGWDHPEGRVPVFLGDLVDRGPYSLATAEHVLGLVAARRAFCLLGNHEYNLAAWSLGLPGWEKPKRSNAPTVADALARPERWRPVVSAAMALPLALELPGLRLVHASWHQPSLEALSAAGHAPASPPPARTGLDRRAATLSLLEAAIRVPAVFAPAPEAEARGPLLSGWGMAPGLRASGRGEPDLPHEILMKGHERDAPEPFADSDGHLRTEMRVTWWQEDDPEVPRDRTIVVGHYWNLPPDAQAASPHWAPPWPSGHPRLRAWWADLGPRLAPSGRRPFTGEVVCVDFNGYGRFMGDRGCVGALRWPERELVWASAPVVTEEAGPPEPSWHGASAPAATRAGPASAPSEGGDAD
jgi:hypothetical protein